MELISRARALRSRLRALNLAVHETRAEVAATRAEVLELRDQLAHEAVRTREILLALRDCEPVQRERLEALRRSPEYELAFSEPEPLVTVVIPTYDNYRLLAERSIPSILAQTYQRFEIIVVGDAAPDEAREIVESITDPRVTYCNRSYRGPYPDDPRARWHVAGVPPYNEATNMAQGRWIAQLGDDDAFRPHHLEVLLEAARRDRLELSYGVSNTYRPDGSTAPLVGRFPPEWGQFCLQTTIYHAGLVPIFPAELTDSLFDMPSDWALCRRMLRAGVRMGMVDSIVADGYPSALWIGREGASSV